MRNKPIRIIEVSGLFDQGEQIENLRQRGPGHRGHGGLHGSPHGGPFGRGRGGRGGRAQRGDVRAAVLKLLAEEPMHGYQIMQAIAERTGGAWTPSPGAIYPTISQLEDEGLVSVVADSGRRLVSLTEAGRQFLTDNEETIADPFADIVPNSGTDLRSAIGQLMVATRAVGMAGNSEQVKKAAELLDQTRKSLYKLLVEDGEAPSVDEKPES